MSYGDASEGRTRSRIGGRRSDWPGADRSRHDRERASARCRGDISRGLDPRGKVAAWEPGVFGESVPGQDPGAGPQLARGL